MTLKEKVKEVEPQMIDDDGVIACPCNYEYLNTGDDNYLCPEEIVTCDECWNREYEEC